MLNFIQPWYGRFVELRQVLHGMQEKSQTACEMSLMRKSLTATHIICDPVNARVHCTSIYN